MRYFDKRRKGSVGFNEMLERYLDYMEDRNTIFYAPSARRYLSMGIRFMIARYFHQYDLGQEIFSRMPLFIIGDTRIGMF